MSKYPITQEQYQVIMGENPSEVKGKKRPVEKVNWHKAREFCKKLSGKIGKTYTLPNESQWEYACRAGTTTPFYFGSSISPSLVSYSNYVCDVGSFPPNAFGLYDMYGNVLEWCQDVWHDNYNRAPNDCSAWETGGITKIIRGGWKSAMRFDHNAEFSGKDLGFRIISPL
ncbi:formylglycine-generating enzyme family protein [Dapis sp. BLCC M229]|uniref:formylglycine-generating enzyme family protein n=1 Tax=Dapis sp. BLCC M229 TaxID=3400188 RepID=UPI003CF401D0